MVLTDLSHSPGPIPNSVERLKSHVFTKALSCLTSTVFPQNLHFAPFSYNPHSLFYNQICPFLGPTKSLPLYKWPSYPLILLLILQILLCCPHLANFKKTCLFSSPCVSLPCPLSFLLARQVRKPRERERATHETLATFLYIVLSCSP